MLNSFHLTITQRDTKVSGKVSLFHIIQVIIAKTEEEKTNKQIISLLVFLSTDFGKQRKQRKMKVKLIFFNGIYASKSF